MNTFLPEQPEGGIHAAQLIRSTEEEKQAQVAAVRSFQRRNGDLSAATLQKLRQVTLRGGNVFAELLEAVKVCSLGQISHALYDVGGRFRRSV